MPWCPICKDEYKEGIRVCADCGCELVDDLSFVMEKDNVEEEDNLLDLAEAFELELDEDEEGINNKETSNESLSTHHVYVNNEEKAEENKTSAYTLITVGIIGILIIILLYFDVIPIHLYAFNKYLISGVMGVMFLLFFIMGLVSLKNYKIFSQKAVKENQLSVEIKKWIVENVNKAMVDDNFDFVGVADELKYFERFNYLIKLVNKQFMNLDQAYVERIVEEVYPNIFEEE